MRLQDERGGLDSRLENVGAEFLVLGHLLIEGIEAHKAYTNYPGYDVVAIDPTSQRQCRIQVKSRWATDYNKTFPIKNFDCDFVVLAALNRGFRCRRRGRAADGGRRPPDFFVFPVDVVQAAQRPESTWGAVPPSRIPELESYRDAWWRVSEFLAQPSNVTRASWLGI
jgi:hypothetical protein